MLSPLAVVAACALLVVAQDAPAVPTFVPTTIPGHFVEQFAGEDWNARWSPSKATKDEVLGEVFSYVGEWSVEEPTVFPGLAGDKGLVMKSKAAHHAISVPFAAPLDPAGKTLVVQYEVKLQKGLECGGAYIKLLTASDVGIQAEEFSDKTPYTIMFGPDRCGATSKVHFIFRHENPITGQVEEKHLVAPPPPKITKTTALYTLIVRPDQTFEIKVNDVSVKTGSLLTDFSPPVSPPAEIDDPTDFKPENWVESPKISDPLAVKPEEWDEDAPQYIVDEEAQVPADWLVNEAASVPDPEAEQPEEWSTEDDGDWDAPMIPNPKCIEASGCGEWSRPEIANPAYKGKWFAPLIDNPEYIGVWAAKKIANPAYFEDLTPANFNTMAGLGIELWSMSEDILFDNIYIGHSEADASALAAETFALKKPLEDALETAAIPPPAKDFNLGEEPDYMTEPLEYVQFKIQEFVTVAYLDPLAAVKALPYTAAAGATALAAVLGLLTIVFSALLPASKPKAKKVPVVAVKKVEVVAPVAVVEKETVTESGVKTRRSKVVASE